MKRLNNRGDVILLYMLAFLAITIGTVHVTKYKTGKWGKNGTEAVTSCHNDDSCWYDASYLRP